MGTAVTARTKSKQHIEVAKTELSRLDSAVKDNLAAIITGTSADDKEAKKVLNDAVKALDPTLAKLDLEESVEAMFHYAATKDPKKRGKFDDFVFKEVEKR